MAYFAVYDVKTGVIENVVECPEFLASTIHIEDYQNILQIDSQISAHNYVVKDNKLMLIN